MLAKVSLFSTIFYFEVSNNPKLKDKYWLSCFLEGIGARYICKVHHWAGFPVRHGAWVQVLCRTATVVFAAEKRALVYNVWHSAVITLSLQQTRPLIQIPTNFWHLKYPRMRIEEKKSINKVFLTRGPSGNIMSRVMNGVLRFSDSSVWFCLLFCQYETKEQLPHTSNTSRGRF